MTDEEKKAIEHLTKKMEYHKERVLDTFVWLTLDEHYVRVLLNLVEKQDNRIKELESDKEIKDKMIEMYIEHIYRSCDFDNRIKTKEQIKQYFENLAKESGEIDEY